VFETRVVEHTGGQVGEREGELLCRADGVDQGLGILDEVPERRPSAGASERILQTAHQLRCLYQELVDQIREVGEEIDQELEWLGDELSQVEAVEFERREIGEVFGRCLERAEHLRRRHAPGERRSQERPSGEADVGVEVRGLPVDEEVVEGLQPSELVGTAGDRAARKDKSDARVLSPRREVALVNDGEAHGSPSSGSPWPRPARGYPAEGTSPGGSARRVTKRLQVQTMCLIREQGKPSSSPPLPPCGSAQDYRKWP